MFFGIWMPRLDTISTIQEFLILQQTLIRVTQKTFQIQEGKDTQEYFKN